ncbi:MAG: hypothetical protein HY929_03545, partial [Euryarchaeota archaeon]|nr:hypothetical protein [Euryarchaeota archaeon]
KPKDLTKVTVRLNTLIDELTNSDYKNIRLVFDSYTTLMLVSGISEISASAIMFARSLFAKMYELKRETAILISTCEVLSHEIETLFNHHIDGVVDLRVKEVASKLQRTLRVRKLIGVIHSTGEVPYEVVEAGIVIRR